MHQEARPTINNFNYEPAVDLILQKEPYALVYLINSIYYAMHQRKANKERGIQELDVSSRNIYFITPALHTISLAKALDSECIPVLRKLLDTHNAVNPLVNVRLPEKLTPVCEFPDPVTFSMASLNFTSNSLSKELVEKLLSEATPEEAGRMMSLLGGISIHHVGEGQYVLAPISSSSFSQFIPEWVQIAVQKSLLNLVDAVAEYREQHGLALEVGIREIIQNYADFCSLIGNDMVSWMKLRALDFSMKDPEKGEGFGYTGSLQVGVEDDMVKVAICIMPQSISVRNAPTIDTSK